MRPTLGLGGLCAAALIGLSVTVAPHTAQAGQQWCPPGLAKKGCVPPGQRKKWAVGHQLPRDVRYRRVYEWERYNLSRPPEGYFYGYVDDDILLIETATRMVVEAVVYGVLLN